MVCKALQVPELQRLLSRLLVEELHGGGEAVVCSQHHRASRLYYRMQLRHVAYVYIVVEGVLDAIHT